ncbi:uncharacterized protein LOC129923388 [Biomphalaria glabrata]|uniref:Uncharacterized protein LOC129923388 n=1 Tax=Biomphalaria glabrata TaxID=6526 RepID=A0A9W2Z592_BIOGL|nr:uncharacterized protein LOC129923388 [Biomphalaria glabrata]
MAEKVYGDLLKLYETGKSLGYQREELDEWVAKIIKQNEERDARMEERKEREEERKEKAKVEEEERKQRAKVEEEERKQRAKVEEEERKQRAKVEEEERKQRAKVEEEKAKIEERKMAMQEEEMRFKWKLEEDQVAAKIKRDDEESKAKIAAIEKESKAKDVEEQENRDTRKRNTPQTKRQKFVEGTDKMDAFINRFEMLMKLEKEPQHEWAIQLLSLVGGKALDALQVLSDDGVANYAILKKTLLDFYQYSEDDYRQKFHELKPPSDGNMKQFVSDVKITFEKWVQASGIEESFENLKQFIIVDKIVSTAGKHLFAFLQERKPRSVETVMELCQTYVAAHPGEILQKVENSEEIEFAATTVPTAARFTRKETAQQRSPPQDRDIQRYTEREQNDYRPNQSSAQRNEVRCFNCRKIGHIAKYCREARRREYWKNDVVAHVGGLAESLSPYVTPAIVNGNHILSLRDTGATKCVLLAKLVSPHQYTKRQCKVQGFGGQVKSYPTAIVHINSPYFNKTVEAIVVDNGPFDLLIGNVPNIEFPKEAQINSWKELYNWKLPQQDDCMQMQQQMAQNPNRKEVQIPSQTSPIETIQQVETRQQKLKREQESSGDDLLNRTRRDDSDETPGGDTMTEKCNPEKFQEAQKKDPTLTKIFNLAKKGTVASTKRSKKEFIIKQGTLIRKYTDQRGEFKQLVTPKEYRLMILQQGHDLSVAGHMGRAKTKQRIQHSFYWPGMDKDIAKYVSSCKICMDMRKNKPRPAPIQRTDLACRPFEKIAVDIIGPTATMSKRGHRYILTIVDFATRWAEAYPLKKATAEETAGALLNLFTRIGFPDTILSDRGVQFTANLTRHITNTLGIKQCFTTPYCPQSNGVCERLNGTVKTMLEKA